MQHIVPFDLPDDGLIEIKGEAYLEGEFLVLVVTSSLMGEFNKDQQIIKIEPNALVEVRLERGIVRDKIYLRPKKRELLEVVPGTYETGLRLKVWKKHRRTAEALVDELERRLAG